jgi:hypothetical protein
MGPFFVVSHGNSAHSKHNPTPFAKAHEAIWHILFCLGTQPASPFGHKPLVILGYFSQAIPHTPIFMIPCFGYSVNFFPSSSAQA